MAQRSRKSNGPSPTLAAALDYAELGMRVFPVKPRMKEPLIGGWQRAATTDPATVAERWSQNPEANIGVCCGRGLVVIDADNEDAEAAVLDLGIPDTAQVRTARGSHFYFEGHSRTRVHVMPGVDVRGSGGYVVGAGSVHPSGATYKWIVSPHELAPQPLPDVLGELLRQQRKEKRGQGETDQPETELTRDGLIQVGCRNTTLTRMAGFMKLGGLNDIAIERALLAQNETGCEEPLPLHEIKAIAASAARWKSPPAWITDPLWFARDDQLTADDRLVLVGLAGHAKDNGWTRVGYRTLGAETGIGKNRVNRAIDRLESKERISLERRRGRTNRTRILKWGAQG